MPATTWALVALGAVAAVLLGSALGWAVYTLWARRAARRRAEATTQPFARPPWRHTARSSIPSLVPYGVSAPEPEPPPALDPLVPSGPTPAIEVTIESERPPLLPPPLPWAARPPEAVTLQVRNPKQVARQAWEAERERATQAWPGLAAFAPPPVTWPRADELTALLDRELGPGLLAAWVAPPDAQGRRLYRLAAPGGRTDDGYVLDRARYASPEALLTDVRALIDLWRRHPHLIPA